MPWFKKNQTNSVESTSEVSEHPIETQQTVTPSIEQKKVPETLSEQALAGEVVEQSAPAPTSKQVSPKTAAQPAHAKSPIAQEIETIMEEGLVDLYVTLDTAHQVEFKKRGEETANMIERLVISAKVTVQKVFQLILSWLKIIPHMNKYYLEQEAKIKADQILKALEEQKAEQV